MNNWYVSSYPIRIFLLKLGMKNYLLRTVRFSVPIDIADKLVVEFIKQ